MKTIFTAALLVVVSALSAPDLVHAQQQSVMIYHRAPDRSGRYIVADLTWDRARSVHLDTQFHPHISGNVYAQPLYWRDSPSEAGTLLVATESNQVHAIDARTGSEIWPRSLGRPESRTSLSCGNISPLGITGTPVIDADTRAIYLNAAIETADGPRHRVFALALKDGAPLPGWPVDVADAVNRTGGDFVPRNQNQRSALTILNGMVYVPFGGHFGDCGHYRGTMLSISLTEPNNVRTGRPAPAVPGSGPRRVRARMATPCLSRPGTASGRRASRTARRSSVCRPICIIPMIHAITLRPLIGMRSMRAMPISAAPTRCCSMCLR